MIRRPTHARIEPLPPGEHDEEVRELLEGVVVPGGFASNIFGTLVRHRGLFRRWLPFGGKLLSGRIPVRERELAILRTAWLCRSNYEWGQHLLIARSAGISDDEIRRVQSGPDTDGWEPLRTRAAARHRRVARRRLHRGRHVGGAGARYDEKQLIELPMLVGHYHLVAFTLNSLGVQLEPGLEGLPVDP